MDRIPYEGMLEREEKRRRDDYGLKDHGLP